MHASSNASPHQPYAAAAMPRHNGRSRRGATTSGVQPSREAVEARTSPLPPDDDRAATMLGPGARALASDVRSPGTKDGSHGSMRSYARGYVGVHEERL